MLSAALLGYAVVGWLAWRVVGVEPLHLYLGLGTLYSFQAAYYKVGLGVDPGYRIPRCKCSMSASDQSEVVLGSTLGRRLGLAIATAGGGLYVAMLVAVWLGHRPLALGMAAAAIVVSAGLGWLMVARLRALCPLCISIAALNVTIAARLAL